MAPLFQNGATGSPAARELHTAFYDATNARCQHVAFYDPASNSMTIFGGVDASGHELTDVWVLRHANGLGGTPSWVQLNTAGGPPPGKGAAGFYGPSSNVMTVFGEISSAPFYVTTNAVWALANANGLNGSTSKWTRLIANGAAGSPPPRAFGNAVYAPAPNRMNASTKLDPFQCDRHRRHACVDQLAPGGQLPAARSQGSAVFDAANNRMIVFGELGYEEISYSVWLLNDATGL